MDFHFHAAAIRVKFVPFLEHGIEVRALFTVVFDIPQFSQREFSLRIVQILEFEISTVSSIKEGILIPLTIISILYSLIRYFAT